MLGLTTIVGSWLRQIFRISAAERDRRAKIKREERAEENSWSISAAEYILYGFQKISQVGISA